MAQVHIIPINLYSEFPLAYYGGGEKLILTVSNYLTDRGFSCTVIENSCSGKRHRVSDDFINSELRCKLIRECFQKTGFTKYFRTFFPVLETIGKNHSSLLIVRRIPGKKYLKKLNKEGKNVVFCLHGIGLEGFRVTNPLIMVHQILIRMQLKRLSRFLRDDNGIYAQTVIKDQSEFLLANSASWEKVFLIENGSWNDMGWPKRNDDTFNILFMGRIENMSKGIDTLRKVVELSFSRKMEFRFTIIGSGSDEKILTDMPQNAQFMSFVDEDKKREILRTSNLMLVTYNFSLQDLSAIEALSYGLPLVSTPTSGLISIISKDGLFGKISTFRPKNIISAIEFYFSAWKEDKAKYFEMRTNIAERARKTFAKEQKLLQYLEMVEKVSSRNSVSNK